MKGKLRKPQKKRKRMRRGPQLWFLSSTNMVQALISFDDSALLLTICTSNTTFSYLAVVHKCTLSCTCWSLCLHKSLICFQQVFYTATNHTALQYTVGPCWDKYWGSCRTFILWAIIAHQKTANIPLSVLLLCKQPKEFTFGKIKTFVLLEFYSYS